MAHENYRAERTISTILKSESDVDRVIRRLLDRDVERGYISVLGKDFQSQTRISGFITKKDVILGGLRTGALFGSLFGSLLSLLTGVGVLFVPFVGSLVAAGPLSSVLLGAATGAIAGGAGAGLASALATLGMPEDKATLYETRVKAGEYLLLVEVPADRSGEYLTLIEAEGGEAVHLKEGALPRPCPGRCQDAGDLSPEIRAHLSDAAQQVFIDCYNSVLDAGESESAAEQAAWQAVHDQFDEDDQGVWSKQKVMA
ncbi:MAG: hypothetical protein HC910_14040 [Spirulinaceae cyanobacterium SM2_1_0]|nr:hypothetical protein [Spirulinaceae cyanobacterium SM2_1_0]